ncbi:MAG: arylamine N-acetyltransferase [Actinomycetota bacterium]
MGRLDDYLHRIGVDTDVGADLSSLRLLHRRHSIEIPYENIDVQLGVPVGLDQDQIFDKLVRRRRGGWCYEHNGLFGWALEEIGFDVTRMVGGVVGEQANDLGHHGNHLVLRVDLDGERLLADVGLGAAMIEPIPLAEGDHTVGERTFRLEATGAGHWRFHNAEGINPPLFELDEQSDEQRLSTMCQALQDDPESVFRQNLIVTRFDASGRHTIALIGRRLTRPGRPAHLVAGDDELVDVLRDEFGLVQDDLHALWPAVAARHAALFPDEV